MVDSQVLSVIRVWAAVAWADGVLVEAEAEGLRRLISTADLTAEERTIAMQVLEGQVSLPDSYLASLEPDARRGIYRAACRMAVVDHRFTEIERGVLDRVRLKLQISDQLGREIEANVPGLV